VSQTVVVSNQTNRERIEKFPVESRVVQTVKPQDIWSPEPTEGLFSVLGSRYNRHKSSRFSRDTRDLTLMQKEPNRELSN
jgi:hypothetical protein